MSGTALRLEINDRHDVMFTQETIASMWGWPYQHGWDDALQLVRDGEIVLVIPWPKDMALDEALIAWANLIGGHSCVHRPAP